MPIAYLALGGNIGDPAGNMRLALDRLDAGPDTTVLGVSRLYRTPPWGKTDQPAFLNAVARIETRLEPEALLDTCLAIERELKRERLERWGPRTIDLDILDYDGRPFRSARLALPHPRMGERAFVLTPLADVAPDLLVAGENIAARLERLDRAGIEPLAGEMDWWRR